MTGTNTRAIDRTPEHGLVDRRPRFAERTLRRGRATAGFQRDGFVTVKPFRCTRDGEWSSKLLGVTHTRGGEGLGVGQTTNGTQPSQ